MISKDCIFPSPAAGFHAPQYLLQPFGVRRPIRADILLLRCDVRFTTQYVRFERRVHAHLHTASRKVKHLYDNIIPYVNCFIQFALDNQSATPLFLRPAASQLPVDQVPLSACAAARAGRIAFPYAS